jgi:hypothetical protein
MPLQDLITSFRSTITSWNIRGWQDRLPAKFRVRGPRIIGMGDKHLWSYDGQADS